jgi:hypothetical protein
MNYSQRLDSVEAILERGEIMPIAELAKCFCMIATEMTCGRNNGSISAGYQYPNSKSLFDPNFTPEDWEWLDANAERFAQAVRTMEER